MNRQHNHRPLVEPLKMISMIFLAWLGIQTLLIVWLVPHATTKNLTVSVSLSTLCTLNLVFLTMSKWAQAKLNEPGEPKAKARTVILSLLLGFLKIASLLGIGYFLWRYQNTSPMTSILFGVSTMVIIPIGISTAWALSPRGLV